MSYSIGSIAQQAWDETRNPTDPAFNAISEIEFKGKLEFMASKVQETGIATTNFEKKVAEILANQELESSPMAVVEAPVNLDAAADGLIDRSSAKTRAVEKIDDAQEHVAEVLGDATAKLAEAKKDGEKVEQAENLKEAQKASKK